MLEKSYNYIVIGAGSAGCVVAARLSENPKASVLVLEAGADDRQYPHILDPGFGYKQAFAGPYDWNFHTTAQKKAAGRKVNQPRGKAFGGSHAINSMLYVRGHTWDYDQWAQMGNAGWSFEEVLPYFKMSEHNEIWQNAFHGQGGPMNVTDRPAYNPLTESFLAAAVACGYPQNPDFNGAEQAGFGYYQVTQKDGKRHSVAHAFLHPTLERPNLTALSGARVTRIRIEGGRAVGVTFLHQGDEHTVAVDDGEIVLSAGAIQSPQILLLSGIGPKAHLGAVGIDVIHELPGVGENFHDHPDTHILCKATPEYDERIRAEYPHQEWYAGGFVFTEDSQPVPDIQFHFLSGRRFGDDEIGYAISPCLLRPKSKGTVRLKDANPMSEPLLDPAYFVNPEDLHTMARGLHIAAEIGARMDHCGETVVAPSDFSNQTAVREFIRNIAATAYHPVGSCKMGHDVMAVVDDRLRVHGLAGLRVIDASIMPEIIGGNTNAPAIMIGEKGAAMLREDA